MAGSALEFCDDCGVVMFIICVLEAAVVAAAISMIACALEVRKSESVLLEYAINEHKLFDEMKIVCYFIRRDVIEDAHRSITEDRHLILILRRINRRYQNSTRAPPG